VKARVHRVGGGKPTAQLWASDPSLLLVHICGTIYHFISDFELSLSEFRRLLKTHAIYLAEDRSA